MDCELSSQDNITNLTISLRNRLESSNPGNRSPKAVSAFTDLRLDLLEALDLLAAQTAGLEESAFAQQELENRVLALRAELDNHSQPAADALSDAVAVQVSTAIDSSLGRFHEQLRELLLSTAQATQSSAAELLATNQLLAEDHEALQARLAIAQSELDNSRQQHATDHAKLLDAQAQLGDAQHELGRTKHALGIAQNKRTETLNERGEAQRELGEARDELGEAQRAISQAQGQIVAITNELEASKIELGDAHQALVEAQRERDAARHELHAAHRERDEARDALEAARCDVRDLSEQLTNAQDGSAASSAEWTATKNQLAETVQRLNENEQLLSELKDRLSESQDQLTASHEKREAAERHSVERNAELEGHRTQLTSTENELAEAQQRLIDAEARLGETLEQLAANQRRYAEEKGDISGSQQRLEQTQRELSNARKSLADMQQQLAESEKRFAESQVQLSNDQGALTVGNERLQKMQEEFAAIKDELHRVTSQRDAQEQSLMDTQSELRAFQEQLQQTAKAQAEHVGQIPEDVIHRLEQLEQDVEAKQVEVQDLLSQNSDLASQVAKYQVAASAARQSTSHINQESLSWEERKKLILQQLEAPEECEAPNAAEKRIEVEEIVSATQREIEQRDREIVELQSIIQQQSNAREGLAIGAAAIAQVIDADQLVNQERVKLKEIQQQWEEKLRKAEIDISLERAKLARERTQMESQLEAARQSPNQNPQPESGESKAQTRTRKWLEHLGLKQD